MSTEKILDATDAANHIGSYKEEQRHFAMLENHIEMQQAKVRQEIERVEVTHGEDTAKINRDGKAAAGAHMIVNDFDGYKEALTRALATHGDFKEQNNALDAQRVSRLAPLVSKAHDLNKEHKDGRNMVAQLLPGARSGEKTLRPFKSNPKLMLAFGLSIGQAKSRCRADEPEQDRMDVDEEEDFRGRRRRADCRQNCRCHQRHPRRQRNR